MKQLKLILVLLTIGMIFLFAVPSVESSEVSAETTNMNTNMNARLQSEEDEGKFYNFLLKLFLREIK